MPTKEFFTVRGRSRKYEKVNTLHVSVHFSWRLFVDAIITKAAYRRLQKTGPVPFVMNSWWDGTILGFMMEMEGHFPMDQPFTSALDRQHSHDMTT
jgi:hypothetical protein